MRQVDQQQNMWADAWLNIALDRRQFLGLSLTPLIAGCGGSSSPTAPTGVIATPGNGQVLLTWTASAGATSYHVKRSTTSGSAYTQVGAPTGTSYADTTGLTNGTPYYYVVTASNAAGTSGYSNEIAATPNAGSSPITPSLVPSRTSGCAPLSVFFDATATGGLTGDDYLNATFAWNFDADNNNPVEHYVKASGFVCGHVFDQPGTYRVHLDVYDKFGQTASRDIAINVSAFSGTTYYVAAAPLGNDSNNGTSMTTPLLTVQYALTNKALPNTQILFRKGDTFNVPDGGIGISGRTGPVIIGSYTDPVNVSTAAPIWMAPHQFTTTNICSFANDDWRVMDIALCAGAHGQGWSGAFSDYGTGTNELFYRLQLHQLGNGPADIGGGGAISLCGSHNAIVECDLYDFWANGIWMAGETIYNLGNMVIGNRLRDSPLNTNIQHMLRFQSGSLCFIGFNQFGPNVVPNFDSLTIRGNSTKVVIYKNTVYDWCTTIQPQNTTLPPVEYQDHVVVDSNLFVQFFPRNGVPQAIRIMATNIVVRNNIICDYQEGIGLGDGTPNVGPSTGVSIYNNTAIYLNKNPVSANDQFSFIYPDPACKFSLNNNLMLDIAHANSPRYLLSYPAYSGNFTSDYNRFYSSTWNPTTVTLFLGNSLSTWRSTTGQDTHSAIADPTLASTVYTDPNFAVPLSGSPLINTGSPSGPKPALDFYGNLRDANTDIGAVEYLP